jgi:hypothetical protein
MKLLVTLYYPVSCYFLSFRPKHMAGHSILEHSLGSALNAMVQNVS